MTVFGWGTGSGIGVGSGMFRYRRRLRDRFRFGYDHHCTGPHTGAGRSRLQPEIVVRGVDKERISHDVPGTGVPVLDVRIRGCTVFQIVTIAPQDAAVNGPIGGEVLDAQGGVTDDGAIDDFKADRHFQGNARGIVADDAVADRTIGAE
jgi:hypothetical protein